MASMPDSRGCERLDGVEVGSRAGRLGGNPDAACLGRVDHVVAAVRDRQGSGDVGSSIVEVACGESKLRGPDPGVGAELGIVHGGSSLHRLRQRARCRVEFTAPEEYV